MEVAVKVSPASVIAALRSAECGARVVLVRRDAFGEGR
jgi:hypothetical protein